MSVVELEHKNCHTIHTIDKAKKIGFFPFLFLSLLHYILGLLPHRQSTSHPFDLFHVKLDAF